MTFTRIAQATATAVLLFAVTAPAAAIERFRSDVTTCAAVQNTLDNAGSAIIQYPSKNVANYLLYDRYVASDAHCQPDERAVPATVIALDDPTCGVQRCIGSRNETQTRRYRSIDIRQLR